MRVPGDTRTGADRSCVVACACGQTLLELAPGERLSLGQAVTGDIRKVTCGSCGKIQTLTVERADG